MVDPKSGERPLKYAACNGKTEVANLLLAHKAEVNAMNAAKQTALIAAANNGFDQMVTILLDRDADANYQDDTGRTALFYATDKEHVTVARKLLHGGAKPNIPDHDGNTPLIRAAISGNKNMVQLLIANRADCSRKNRGNQNAIYQSILRSAIGHPEEDIIKTLLLYTSPLSEPFPQTLDVTLTRNTPTKGCLKIEYTTTITEEEAKKLMQAVEQGSGKTRDLHL